MKSSKSINDKSFSQLPKKIQSSKNIELVTPVRHKSHIISPKDMQALQMNYSYIHDMNPYVNYSVINNNYQVMDRYPSTISNKLIPKHGFYTSKNPLNRFSTHQANTKYKSSFFIYN